MIELLIGSNSFALDEYLQKKQKTFIAQQGDMALERSDGLELSADALIDSVQSVPFLATKKMVIVREASKNKEITDAIERIIERTNESTELVFVDPKVDKRSVFYKTLKKQATVQVFDDLDEPSLVRWIVATVKEQGGTITSAVAQTLLRRTGNMQQLLARQIETLLLYSGEITQETVELLIEPSPQSSVFDLIDAAFRGDRKKAIWLYEDQRKQKIEPQQIIGMFVWQLHILALVLASGGKSADTIASEAKVSPFVVRKSQALASKTSFEKIVKLTSELVSIDTAIKSSSVNPDTLLKNFIIAMK